ncbi:exodeoxyribonuclease VII small subunit [Aeromicrobium sp. UC242_57]|uniref:exodeoxyribonuclease VII small subunit n=1 Tax=Aeromicrobium sp. UC242_57 TaxID=3374624 RepID=UPI00378A4544
MRERASLAIRSMLDREARGLADLRSRPVLSRPATLIESEEDRLHDVRDRARRSLGHRLDRASDEIGHHLARVRGLSPLATLERGYAVAQLPDGTVITSIGQVSAGAPLHDPGRRRHHHGQHPIHRGAPPWLTPPPRTPSPRPTSATSRPATSSSPSCRSLETGGTSLDESLALWERGELLAGICQQWLDGAKARLAAAQNGQSGQNGQDVVSDEM